MTHQLIKSCQTGSESFAAKPSAQETQEYQAQSSQGPGAGPARSCPGRRPGADPQPGKDQCHHPALLGHLLRHQVQPEGKIGRDLHRSNPEGQSYEKSPRSLGGRKAAHPGAECKQRQTDAPSSQDLGDMTAGFF